VFFVGLAMLFIDRAGRRILMMIGIAGMTLSTMLLASMFQVHNT
jgi:MFS family permease